VCIFAVPFAKKQAKKQIENLDMALEGTRTEECEIRSKTGHVSMCITIDSLPF